jgi:hypothetical protein
MPVVVIGLVAVTAGMPPIGVRRVIAIVARRAVVVGRVTGAIVIMAAALVRGAMTPLDLAFHSAHVFRSLFP